MHHHQLVVTLKVPLWVESPTPHFFLKEVIHVVLVVANVRLHIFPEPFQEFSVLLIVSSLLEELSMQCLLNPVALSVGQLPIEHAIYVHLEDIRVTRFVLDVHKVIGWVIQRQVRFESH